MDYKKNILRIIDANINRSKEGLRVCEDILRLFFSDKKCTKSLKEIRHQISTIIIRSKIGNFQAIKNRDSELDIGRKIKLSRSKYNLGDIFVANSNRVKESLRVLEEMFGIIDIRTSNKFQDLRFKYYSIEKYCLTKFKFK